MPLSLQQEEALVRAASEMPADKRQAFLDTMCAGDAALRARVAELLDRPEEPAPPAGPRATIKIELIAEDEAIGKNIGPYKLLQKIGEGGCGSVYMADQEQPLHRRVAVKVIKLGMDTKAVIARFEAERQALALMDHPNIAKVLDAGSTETGRPYFVMELVRGIKITDYCDQNKLATRERLELFIRICQAIQHAHQKGIIHRDVKPSNILVTLHDGLPVPKVIDFGIAKATTGQRLTDKTLFTAYEQFIGTPAYMSPEQAEMSGLDIDTRCDIYSLGVLLYELLAGATPFDAVDLMSQGIDAMRRTIREQEPVRPSTKVAKLRREEQTTTAKRRSVDLPKLIHQLKGDLDWIVMKCLEKDRTRRYETANGLAMDLKRHLDNEPIVARPPNAAYLLRKFVIRHKWPVILSATFAALIVSSLIVLSIGLQRETLALDQADVNAAMARLSASEARKAEASALEEKAFALRQAYSASMASACDAFQNSQFSTARHYLNSTPADLRGWEWRQLSSRLDRATRVQEHPRMDRSQVHVAPDGRSYYDVCPDPTKTIQRWDSATGRLLATIPTAGPCWYSWLVAGGKEMALLISDVADHAGTIEIWDLEHNTRLSSRPTLWPVCVAPDGSRFAYLAEDKMVVVDTGSGATRSSPSAVTSGPPGQPGLIFFQPDGRRLAICKALGEVALLDADSLEVLSTFKAHDNSIQTAVFSADSRRLATGSLDSTIRITDVAARPPALVATLRGHAGVVTGVCFSPDGSLLASCGEDRTLRVWDARTGNPRSVDEVDGLDLNFLPDGRTLINGETNGVRFRDVRALDAWILRGHNSYVYPVLLSPDGTTIYSGGWDGFVGKPGCLRFWDAATGDPIAATGAADSYVLGAALSGDGSLLSVALAASNRKIAHIDTIATATGATVSSVTEVDQSPIIHPVESLVFDPASPNFVWVDQQGVVCLTDARTGLLRKSRQLLRTATNVLRSRVAWSSDGATIAVALFQDPSIYLLDGRSLELVHQWPHRHKGEVNFVSFSPDGRRILTASEDGTVRVLDAATGAPLHELVGQANRLFCAVYSPDGTRIASGGGDGNIRIWDARTFDQVARLNGHDQYVYSLAWRADSQQLISGSGDHTVRIWDTVPTRERVQARDERQAVLAQVEPMVRRLFAELGDAGKVVESLKSDQSLNAHARQIALQVVLRTSLDRQNGAAAQPSR